jgi:hypothetical protein
VRKSINYAPVIFGALLCGVQYSHASPAVTGASGTVSQGSVITVSGSGFGTKPTAAPYYFNDFESATVGQTALQAGLDDEGNDGQGIPYVRNDKAFSGKNSLRMDYLVNKDSMFPRIGKGGLNSNMVYVSVWTYWTHTAGSGGSPFIFKMVRGGANPSYSGVPKFYETIRPSLAGVVGATDRGSVNSSNVSTYSDNVNAGQNSDGWHRSEYYFKLSDAGVANGQYQTWVDGVLNANVSNTMSRLAGTTSTINYVMSPFDGIDSYGTTNSYQVWVDDFYVDTTLARVEIGDASTLAGCKKRTVLPSKTWSDSSITANANVGMFPSGSKAYLYVFDANGNANATGYAVTIGASTTSGGTTTTAVVPQPPSDVSVQ